jgi:hypothetical protein
MVRSSADSAGRRPVVSFHSMNRLRSLPALAALLLAACEGSGAHVVGPVGRETFNTYVAIGTGLSMGMQAGGVLYNSQVEAWPALLAHQAGSSISTPLLRAPGCTPPLIAPLQFGRFLSGASSAVRDSSCAGTLGTITPPTNNVALAGPTASLAMNLTPKIVAATPASYDVGDRSRYPIVLGNTQSQVTAMLVQSPSFVSVELGLAEVMAAATSGLVVPATSYTQTTRFTYVPASVFAPVYAAVADSVKKSGAKAVLLGVPRVTTFAALRTGDELYAKRAEFGPYGVTVSVDCSGSANLVFTAQVVPALVAAAQASRSVQTLSCADVPGAADYVLTPADVAALNGSVDAMNVQIKALADQNGWAFVDVDAVFSTLRSARSGYNVLIQFTCLSPYGRFVSLDGVFPNLAGHQLLANAVTAAINAKYGFAIPTGTVTTVTALGPCP